MGIKRILYATDLSPVGASALDYAAALAKDSGATLLIAYVEPLPPMLIGPEMYMPPMDVSIPELQSLLEEVVPADKTVHCEHRLLRGFAADEIVGLAEQEKVDLIVMSTHGRTGVSRTLMGSVAEAVLRRAPCPVLTVKQANYVPAEVA